jgi:hypothetical protein
MDRFAEPVNGRAMTNEIPSIPLCPESQLEPALSAASALMWRSKIADLAAVQLFQRQRQVLFAKHCDFREQILSNGTMGDSDKLSK